MKKKVLEKYITRSGSLIALEAWQIGADIEFKKLFEIEFSKNLFRLINGTMECYRNNDNQMKKLPQAMSKWAKKNDNKLDSILKKVDDGVELYEKIKIKGDISNKQILKNIEDIKNAFATGFSGIYISHWIPLWSDYYLEKKKKLFDKNIINKMRKSREGSGNELYNVCTEKINFMFTMLSQKNGWKKDLLQHITFEELEDVILRNKKFPKEKLEKRFSTPYYYIDGKIFSEEKINDYLEKIGYEMKEINIDNIDEIKGQIANKGKASGVVRVVLSRKELDKFNKGDILVAPMTTPWYVPIMKIAGAIVTDEGGVVCHAAIISRELDKPCVIATKIATQVLKDGDEVEVDADKGTIKILNKK